MGVLAAGVGVPLLVALHVLRLRRLPQRVPSTLLWRRSVQDLEANAPFQRLRWTLLFLLQLTALLLASLAAAQPVLRRGSADAGLVVVLDARARMNVPAEPPSAAEAAAGAAADAAADAAANAGPAPESRFQRARRRAVELLQARRGTPETCHLVVARAVPALVASGSARAVADAAALVQPTDEPGSLEDAIRLAGQAAPDAAMVVLDDAAVSGWWPGNTGIVTLAAERSLEEPGSADVLVGVLNSGPAALEAPLAVELDGRVAAARSIQLPGAGPAGAGRAAVIVRVPYAPEALLEVRLDSGDAFPLDDAAGLRFRPRAPWRIAFAAPGPAEEAQASPLLSLLRLLDDVSVTIVPCDAPAEALRSFDLVAADGCMPSGWRAPEGSAPGPALLAFAADGSAGPPAARRGTLHPEVRSHPVARGVPPFVAEAAMGAASATASAAAPASSRPLLQDGPVTMAWVDDASRQIRVLFPTSASTWPADPSWVMLMQNAVEWLLGRRAEALGQALRTGAEGSVIFADASGMRTERRVPARPRVGRVTVEGSGRDHPVSLLDEVQSDLRPGAAGGSPGGGAAAVASSAAGARPARPASSAQPLDRPVWPWLALAALVLMTAEWSLFTARSWRIHA